MPPPVRPAFVSRTPRARRRPGGAGPLSVRVRTDLSGLEAAWDRLGDGAVRPTPFLRSWWLGARTPGTTVLVCVEDAGDLVGGMRSTSVRGGRAAA